MSGVASKIASAGASMFEALRGVAGPAAEWAVGTGGRLAKAAPGMARSAAAGMVGLDETTRGLIGSADPLKALLGGAMLYQGGKFAAEAVVEPMLDATVRRGRREEKLVADERALRRDLALQKMAQMRRRADIVANAEILAKVNPELYTQVLAGRRLARGAIVLGGQPRMDLLQQIALDMAKKAGRSEERAVKDQLMESLVSGALSDQNDPLS